MSMKCPLCSLDNDDNSKFCVNCGHRFNAPSGSGGKKIYRIGRAPDNDVVVDDPYVSGHHCEITILDGNNCRISDIGSRNGTFIDNQRITQSTVKLNTMVRLGHHYQFSPSSLVSKQPSSTSPPPEKADLTGKTKITIGRDPTNDIVLSNIRVSRFHARMDKQGTNWVINDLNSRNGTFVNGEQVNQKAVSIKDNITIGGVPLRLNEILYQPQTDWNSNIRFIAHDLTFTVTDKIIVDSVSLSFQPGQFVGLIGPSGCGKTTLMMMLNGYLQPSEGCVRLNSASLYQNPNAFYGQIGYVPQDDIIHRELTVRESLDYTSKLRLGNSINPTERQQQIDGILKVLNIEKIKDVQIGSVENKGISGGQRKRVNMAQELITEPLIYFLDEPTSGLDPRTDTEVMRLLRGIADKGHIVILTTHKIDRLNFSIFSHIIVMGHGGKLAYFGPTADALAYFNVDNPEDIFEVLELENSTALQKRYRNTEYHQKLVKLGAQGVAVCGSPPRKDTYVGGFYQFFVLCSRMLKIKIRDKSNLAILALQAPIIGLIIYFAFLSKDDVNKLPLFFMSLISAIWLGCANASTEIVSERTIFKREQKVNLKIFPYMASKIMILTLFSLVQCLILAALSYRNGIHNFEFGIYYLILCSVSFCAINMGLVISSLVRNSGSAAALVPYSLIPQIIFGGTIILYKDLREVMQLLSGGMLSRRGLEIMLNLHNDEGLYTVTGFNQDNLTDALVIVVVMTVLFIFTTYMILYNSTKKLTGK
ncbi:MAG: FHA domain-containing protein [Candidatus Cloacimonetes bacterium]|nr:FHA domain-containing protein [Candidatus Cloacimonadota bacterium]